MSLHNIRGQQQAAADVLTDLAGHIVPLYAVDRGIFIEFSCLTSSLLHSIRLKIWLSVVLDWRTRFRV